LSAVNRPTDDPLYDDEGGPRRLRIGVLAALGVAVVLIGVIAIGSASNGTKVGAETAEEGTPADRAPDFSVTLFDGSGFRLSDHLADDGRPVLLNLWASWCPPCRAEMPDLSAAAERHPEVLFIGVAVEDDPAAARAFAESIQVAYPVGADLDGSVDRAYPAPGLPATYVIDGEGLVRATRYGQVTDREIEALLAEHLG
jgi:thiol-disulfide isomerase/thioredoxin